MISMNTTQNTELETMDFNDQDLDMFKDSGFMSFLLNNTMPEEEKPIPEPQLQLVHRKDNLIKFDGGRVLTYTELRKVIKRMKLDESEESLQNNFVECRYCDVMFTVADFQNHICPVQNETKGLLGIRKGKIQESLDEGFEKGLRLIKENQVRYRVLLKDDLKFDINACITSFGETTKTFNDKKYGPHQCRLCDRKFVHASGLVRHMEKHDSNTISGSKQQTVVDPEADKTLGLLVVLVCNLCGRAFVKKESAHAHLSDHFTSYDLIPTKVDFDMNEVQSTQYTLEVLEYLSKHENHEVELKENLESDFYTSIHTNTYFRAYVTNCLLQCEFCDYFFTDTCFLLLHESNHSPCRPFECFRCEIFCGNIKDITTHWQGDCVTMRDEFSSLQHFPRYYECNVCEHKFPSLESLQEHRQSSEHPFPRFNHFDKSKLCTSCELCSKIFYTSAELYAHYEESHFRSSSPEKDNASEKARTFLCEICGKSYTQSSHLWQHLRFHQGVKPFVCTIEGCTRRFTIRPDLNDHIRKCHTGERPYHCVVCGKRFLTGSVFYQHRLIHRGERRYKCHTCGKKFYRADALKNHSRIHTGEKPFGCAYCTKTFRQRGDRDKHVRARHAHLDPRARLMMQMQKIQLEAQAQNANGEEGGDTENDIGSEKLSRLVAQFSSTEMRNILANSVDQE